MAIFYFNAQAISRSSGKNACRAAAYNARTEIVDLKTGKFYDYSDRTDLAHSLIMTPKVDGRSFKIDRSTLWNLVESTEHRADSQLARSLVLALPTEIDHQAKWLLTQKFVRDNFTSQGTIADVNIHDIDSHNPHVHILLTMRDINEIIPSGEIVFGLKNRTWNDKKLLEQQKESWANTVNKCLELARVPDRIDYHTPTDRVPQIHIGTTAWKMEKRGIKTERGDLHREIAQTNRNIELLYNTAAATQQSLEIELRLEVQRREAQQQKESKHKQERESRRQKNPLGKFINRVERFFVDDPIEQPEVSTPEVEVISEQPETSVDKFLRQQQEQRAARELEAAESKKYVEEILANNPQLTEVTPEIDPIALEQEERDRAAQLEQRRLANRAINQRTKLAFEKKAQTEAAQKEQLSPLTEPPAQIEQPIQAPVPTAPELQAYIPTRLEIVNWYKATKPDSRERQEIEAIGQQLKNAYMLQESMQDKPEPNQLPDYYKNTTVTISIIDKQRFDQNLAELDRKNRSTPLGRFIEDVKEIAKQDPTGQQTFNTSKTFITLDRIANEDPINRAGINLLNRQLFNNLENKTIDTENLNKLIVKLERIRDNPEHYQNLERQREIEQRNINLRTNTRDRGGRGR